MQKEQKIVGVGAASGVASMILFVWLLSLAIPQPVFIFDMGDRLAYALGANVFALLPLFIMLITVGNSRFLSKAINPLVHAESKTMEIDGRVVDNTLQQSFVFLVATLGVSTVVPVTQLQIIWAASLVFVIARAFFWLGYRIDPLYRAPGMAATAYLNLFLIVYTLYQILF